MNATPHRERPGHQWTLWAFAVVATVLLAAAIPTHPDVSAQQSKPEPPPAEAARLFEVNCAMCHGNDGRGAERGPDIVSSRQAVGRSFEDLERIIRTGVPAGGMPPTAMSAEAIGHVARYVRAVAAASQQPRTFRLVRLVRTRRILLWRQHAERSRRGRQEIFTGDRRANGQAGVGVSTARGE